MASSMLYVGLERQQEAIISGTTTYSADLWDGWSLSYECLAIATAKNEAEAIINAIAGKNDGVLPWIKRRW